MSNRADRRAEARESKPIPPSDGGVVRAGAAEVAADRMDEMAGEDAQIGGADGRRV